MTSHNRFSAGAKCKKKFKKQQCKKKKTINRALNYRNGDVEGNSVSVLEIFEEKDPFVKKYCSYVSKHSAYKKQSVGVYRYISTLGRGMTDPRVSKGQRGTFFSFNCDNSEENISFRILRGKICINLIGLIWNRILFDASPSRRGWRCF